MVNSHPLNDQLSDLGISDSMDASLSFMINQGGMGAILVLKMSDRDYAPSQISRWIEENDAKILGLLIGYADQGMLNVNIKLNTSSVKNILATLSRQNINVEQVFMADDYDENDTKAYDVVFKFLDL
jgi:acetoin utilization protein AcuB